MNPERSGLNLREQALAAMQFKEQFPTPYTIWYDDETKKKVAAAVGDEEWNARLRNCILRISVDWEPKHYLRPGYFRDLHGAEWQEGVPLHLVKPALVKPDLKGYAIPGYAQHVRFAPALPPPQKHETIPFFSFEQARQKVAAENHSVFTVVGFGYGVFERAWMIRGFEDFFCDLVQEPVFAHELLDLVLQRQLELLDVLLELPCDGIIFSDDWGDQRGVIIGPHLWREFIKPRARQLYAKAHAAGKMTFQHTCGNVFDIIPDLIEIGLDCLQSLQPEAMPVYEVKKLYGRALRLWGGLGTQQLLPFGTPDKIRAEIRNLREHLGKDGGYIFTSSKPIFHDVPIQNVLAFIEETTGVKF